MVKLCGTKKSMKLLRKMDKEWTFHEQLCLINVYVFTILSFKGIGTLFLKKLPFERAVIDNELFEWKRKSFNFSQ